MAATLLAGAPVNPRLEHLSFPWPSLVVSRGNELEALHKQGVKLPFPNVIHAHAGDPQGMGQPPITFFQQVLSLCLEPELLNSPRFAEDAKHRARLLLEECGSIGRLSPPEGMEVVRKQVARYLVERDGGTAADWGDVFLSSGATEGIRAMLSLLNCPGDDGKPAGVLVPVPQYPLFSSTVAEYGMHQISYQLDEDRDWALDLQELRDALEAARPHCQPRVLVVINPGNPGGFVLSRQDIEDIIKLAYKEGLFILADEVYQYNVYADNVHFVSFKKVLRELEEPYCSLGLASFMSGSKGYMGECGARSGFCEAVNLDEDSRQILSVFLQGRVCPSTLGQVITFCITYPPRAGEPSHGQFCRERDAILRSLRHRAELCHARLNSVPGLSCRRIVGAMYAFPRVDLPESACRDAQERGLTPDELYTLEMLETSGICVLPGHLFGQKEGTFHFRLTFLPQEPELRVILDRIVDFHTKFMAKYTN